MKTKSDISIQILVILLGAIFLISPLRNISMLDNSGKFLLTFGLSIIIFGIWKIENVRIENGILTKYNFISLFKRKRDLTDVVKYKTKLIDLSLSRYNLANILRFFKSGDRYSKFRILTLYFNGQLNMKIDERVMSQQDFDKILSGVKKNFSKQKVKT